VKVDRTPQFRALSADAAQRCASLHKLSFAFPWSVSEFERLLTDPSVIADGAGANGTLQGFVLSRIAGEEAEILSIAVEPAARRSGTATVLLGRHLSRLARAGVRELFLEVDENNVAALALYRRYGFVQVGTRESYYARPDGTRTAACVLRCAL
jgi:[ribosomal protein S18]-alanine N-acetyltransferase